MAVEAVVFDVGETLVEETRGWAEIADELGVPRFAFAGVIGGRFEPGALYDDARPCLAELRPRGYLHDPPEGTAEIGSLYELPQVLERV